jgi:hypothetical protein
MKILAPDLPPDFWEPRDCFEHPPSEVHEAVDLFDQAADAIVNGDQARARLLIAQADLAPIFDFVERIWGKVDLNIHRFRNVPGAPLRDKTCKERMPSASKKLEIYLRDGWRCRFCGIRVISPKALLILQKHFPDVARSGPRNKDNHSAFLALKAVVDHLLPHSRGGNNDPYNLVTTCGPCNYGRSYWIIEEVGIKDPRQRPPIVDHWDGLARVERFVGLPVSPI